MAGAQGGGAHSIAVGALPSRSARIAPAVGRRHQVSLQRRHRAARGGPLHLFAGPLSGFFFGLSFIRSDSVWRVLQDWVPHRAPPDHRPGRGTFVYFRGDFIGRVQHRAGGMVVQQQISLVWRAAFIRADDQLRVVSGPGGDRHPDDCGHDELARHRRASAGHMAPQWNSNLSSPLEYLRPTPRFPGLFHGRDRRNQPRAL